MTTDSIASDATFETAVVGLDGSSGSRHALEWTVHNAGPHATLHLVHGASPASGLAVASLQPDPGELVAEPNRYLVEEWVAGLSNDDVDLVYHVLEEEPAAALVKIAGEAGAQAIVVGAHHQSKLGPRRIGSTVARLIEDPVTPIAVVPEHGDLVPTGSVVVGVGDDASITRALRWAVAYASTHELALSLVRVSPSRPLFSIDGLVSMLAYYIDPAVLSTWAFDDLAELAAEIRRSTDEELTISWSAPKRTRGPRLVEESADAALLVVDVRPDPDSPVPSWLHHAVRHAPCPIMLFPAPAGDHGIGGSGDGG
jgi:nucleotide-binding universal stress UspA family protein